MQYRNKITSAGIEKPYVFCTVGDFPFPFYRRIYLSNLNTAIKLLVIDMEKVTGRNRSSIYRNFREKGLKYKKDYDYSE